MRENLATEIPYSSQIERMTLRRAPLPAYAPKSAEGPVYATLWREIESRVTSAERITLVETSRPAHPDTQDD